MARNVVLVAGARPNFMKIAPLMAALKRLAPGLSPYLVHTGQHYDEALSAVFFDELGIPRPDCDLEVGSGSHAWQTAEIMVRFERVLESRPANGVLVVGDVNSTVACGLVAVKKGVPLIHVEAGLRSFDRSMPEEINRVVVDAIADLLFVTEPSGVDHLRAEGVAEEKIHLVGNVMIDTLLQHRERARESTVLERLGLEPKSYAVLTLHRPSNVDRKERLQGLIDVIEEVAERLPVVFPLHPRTRNRLEAFGLLDRLQRHVGMRATEPLGYLDFLRLQADARLVMTDSGGIQEETTVLGVPCLTLRDNTERPITVEAGTNELVGTDPSRIRERVFARLASPLPLEPPQPPLWDGKAAERIVRVLAERL